MPTFRISITVACANADEAEMVAAERLQHDEDYGFEYRFGPYEVADVVTLPVTESEWKARHADIEGDLDPSEHVGVIVERWHDPSETPSEAINRLNAEVIYLATGEDPT